MAGVHVRGRLLLKLESTLFQGEYDLGAVALRHENVIRKVGRDEEDGAGAVSLE